MRFLKYLGPKYFPLSSCVPICKNNSQSECLRFFKIVLQDLGAGLGNYSLSRRKYVGVRIRNMR